MYIHNTATLYKNLLFPNILNLSVKYPFYCELQQKYKIF